MTFGSTRISDLGTYFISTAMIEVVVGGDGCYYFDAGVFGGGGYFADIIGVYCSGLVGFVVYKKVCIVVIAYGYGYDLHSGSSGGREWGSLRFGYGRCWTEEKEGRF